MADEQLKESNKKFVETARGYASNITADDLAAYLSNKKTAVNILWAAFADLVDEGAIQPDVAFLVIYALAKEEQKLGDELSVPLTGNIGKGRNDGRC